MIVTIRTDIPEATVELWDGNLLIAGLSWTAHRALAGTLHKKIDELLGGHNTTLSDVTGIVAYNGPGSFTGLRIGVSVTNALGYSLQIPVVGASGSEWQQNGISQLMNITSKERTIVVPNYGVPAATTSPKK